MTREYAIEHCEKYVEVDKRGARDLVSFLNKIYDDFEKELKQGQDNYNKLWAMYSELKKEKDNNERI